jgi:hypothetical protein
VGVESDDVSEDLGILSPRLDVRIGGEDRPERATHESESKLGIPTMTGAAIPYPRLI